MNLGKFWKFLFRLFVAVSILFNLLMLLELATLPTYKQGLLVQDITVEADLNTSEGRSITTLKIPKGLTVMNASPQGLARVGLFEPERFSIVVTTDSNWVDYSPNIRKAPLGALYRGIRD